MNEKTKGVVIEVLRLIAAIIAAILTVLGATVVTGCTVQHKVRQTSETTIEKESNGDKTTETYRTTIEYGQEGSGNK